MFGRKAMSKLSYRRNKKTGVTYVYSIEKSYWDKDKKSPRNKQVCLGKLNAKTGEIIPSKRRHKIVERAVSASPGVTATSRVAGPYVLLEKITHDHCLDKLLEKCFSGKWKLMLSLVYFLVHRGVALSRAEPWSKSCLHPFNEPIASQRISELLKEVSEDERQRFLAIWLERVLEGDYLCYDVTSVSSYAKRNEYTHYGYNRDNEHLEQINLAMLFGQNSQLPVYYRRTPGNISDVATLKTTVKSLGFLGADSIHLVLDKGFYSIANIDELYRRHHKFTIALPIGRKWVEDYLVKHRDNIAFPTNYLEIEKNEALYAVTELHKWGQNKHRGYLHLYYSAEHAASDFDCFTRKLISYRNELLEGRPVQDNEDYYRRYFIVRETPKRGLKVDYNEEEILKYRNCYSGFFCILSNKIKDAAEALKVYRNKDMVENCFDDLKNQLDMKRLRVHSAAAMDCRLFIQFLSLIYISAIRNTIQTDSKLKHLTVREVMEEMETLTRIKYSNHYGEVFTEASPMQRHIMKTFDFELPT